MERHVHRSQLSVIGLSFIVVSVVVLILYGYKPNQPQSVYHEELQQNSEQVNIIQSPDTKTLDSDDKIKETNQKMTSPTEHVQVNSKQEGHHKETSQKMTSPTKHVQVNSKQEGHHKETSQKIASPVEQIQVKPKQQKPKEKSNQVKLSNRPVNIKQPATKKQDDRGVNATHINGILMEPVHASYTRNIYFTVKTTYKNYVGRLFPLMLTWFQVVDKNKVRHC